MDRPSGDSIHSSDPVDGEIPSRDSTCTKSELSSQEKVFGNQQIMPKFLSNLLWREYMSTIQSTPELSSADARPLRLVSKIIEDHLRPLYSFEVIGNNSGDAIRTNTKFANFMEGLMLCPPPPISLVIQEPSETSPLLEMLFSPQNAAASSLVQLEIRNFFNMNPVILPEIPSDLKLPFLDEFIVCQRFSVPRDEMVTFINSILEASVMLRKLKLWKFSFSGVQEESVDYNLPGPLRQLTINFKDIWTSVNKSTPLVLPHLRELVIWEDGEPIQDFGQDFQGKVDWSMPKLDKLVLDLQSRRELRRWCRPQWPAIKTLNLCGIEPIPQAAMAKIHEAFAGLVNLELVFDSQSNTGNWTDWLKSGMGYIFQEMGHLRCLKVKVCECEPTFEKYSCDSILLGIESSEVAYQLEQDPSLWEEFLKRDDLENGERRFRRMSSVRDLTKLECLHFEAQPNSEEECILFRARPLTELVFQLGFMKMPKLRELTLGCLNVGLEELGQRWESQVSGRRFKLGKGY